MINTGSVILVYYCMESTPCPSAAPSSFPTPAPDIARLEPNRIIALDESDLYISLYLNSGTQKVAAYDIDIIYNPVYLTVNSSMGTNGVDPGADGFITTVNAETPGIVVTSGFDSSGKGPGSNLHLYTLHMRTNTTAGSTYMEPVINNLADENNTPFSQLSTRGGWITILCTKGDVQGDGAIDIVDALLIARYYVGIYSSIRLCAADVNCDNSVDIVDALLIARFYVDLITEFC